VDNATVTNGSKNCLSYINVNTDTANTSLDDPTIVCKRCKYGYAILTDGNGIVTCTHDRLIDKCVAFEWKYNT